MGVVFREYQWGIRGGIKISKKQNVILKGLRVTNFETAVFGLSQCQQQTGEVRLVCFERKGKNVRRIRD